MLKMMMLSTYLSLGPLLTRGTDKSGLLQIFAMFQRFEGDSTPVYNWRHNLSGEILTGSFCKEELLLGHHDNKIEKVVQKGQIPGD